MNQKTNLFQRVSFPHRVVVEGGADMDVKGIIYKEIGD